MVGVGRGKGYNINIAWNGEGPFGDEEYFAAFDSVVIPAARTFDPELILVAAGFDAGIGDPLGGCYVTPMGFAQMLYMISAFAEGKVLVALEGGYNLTTISASMLCCASVLLGDPLPLRNKQDGKTPSLDAIRAINQTLIEHSRLDVEFSEVWTKSFQSLYQEEILLEGDIEANFSEESTRFPHQDIVESSIPPSLSDRLGNDQNHLESNKPRYLENLYLVDVASFHDDLQEEIRQPPSIEDGRPQSDTPCEECSRTNHPFKALTNDNLVCLRCYSVYCSGHKRGHAKEHAHLTGHRLALSLSDLTIWDFKNNTYLDGVSEPELRPIVNIFHRDKFGQNLPKATGSTDLD